MYAYSCEVCLLPQIWEKSEVLARSAFTSRPHVGPGAPHNNKHISWLFGRKKRVTSYIINHIWQTLLHQHQHTARAITIVSLDLCTMQTATIASATIVCFMIFSMCIVHICCITVCFVMLCHVLHWCRIHLLMMKAENYNALGEFLTCHIKSQIVKQIQILLYVLQCWSNTNCMLQQ